MIAFPISQAYYDLYSKPKFSGGNDCISEFERISKFHGNESTFYGNDCISDSKLRSARKSFTEMIAFPILKYNNHNTVTLYGNDCISDFQ